MLAFEELAARLPTCARQTRRFRLESGDFGAKEFIAPALFAKLGGSPDAATYAQQNEYEHDVNQCA